MINKMLTPRLKTSTALLGAVFFLCLGIRAAAEPVVVKSFRSPVEVMRAGTKEKWSPVRVGLELNAGDVVRSGIGAKVELKMSDGSRMLLSSESRLEIKQNTTNRFFSLEFGRLKSYIKKLKGANKFEVHTPLAAASVRGTVFEVGFDARKKQGYLDVSEGTVALAKDGREILVREGQRVNYLPDRPLDAPSFRTSGADDRAAVRHEVGLGMSKEDVMAAAADEMRLAEYQEGKTLIDVNGDRVRLEEYIIRQPKEVAAADRDKAFKLVVLNDREERFDYFYYRGIFNTTLPTDLSVALADMGGKLGAASPSYYLTAYEMGQSNTTDSIQDTASGGHLVKVTYDGTNYTLTDADSAANVRTVTEDEKTVVDGVTYHKIYDPVNDRFSSLTETQYAAGDFRPVVYDPADDTFRNMKSGDTYWGPRYNSYSHMLNSVSKQSYAAKTTGVNTLAVDLDADFTYKGGTLLAVAESPSGADKFHSRVTLFYGDGSTEVYNTYIISDEGKIASTSAFKGVTTGVDFKAELLKWNYEQVAAATEFNGRKIDLVVEPKILIKSRLIK